MSTSYWRRTALLTTFELGAKSEFFDRRLRLNVAAFFSRYTDIQISRNTVDNDGAYIRLEQNAGTARIFGFEAEITAAPVRGLQLNATAGYNNFRFSSLLPQMAAMGTPLLTLDNKLPFTPSLVGTVSAAYRILIGVGGRSRRARICTIQAATTSTSTTLRPLSRTRLCC